MSRSFQIHPPVDSIGGSRTPTPGYHGRILGVSRTPITGDRGQKSSFSLGQSMAYKTVTRARVFNFLTKSFGNEWGLWITIAFWRPRPANSGARQRMLGAVPARLRS